MSKNVKILLCCVLGLAFIAVITKSNVTAQAVSSGYWTASLVQEKSDKVNLNLERHTQKGGKNQMGQTYDFADLQGLTREQAQSGGPVKFSLVRQAGRIDCEGNFQNGKGSGTFRFTPDHSFVLAMKARGFDFEEKLAESNDEQISEDRLFAATTLNVTTALADDLLSAGFGKLQVEDLFKASIFKIDADFVSQVTQMGFDKEPFESLVKMRIFKVTPDFLTEVRNEGLTNLSVEEIVKLRIFKIDREFIRQAKAEGVPLEVEELVRRRIGVGDK